MGRSVCPRVREALESARAPHRFVLAGRRDVHLHSREMALPVSSCRQAGQERRFSAASGSWHSGGAGVLPKGADDESYALAAQGDPGWPYSESPGTTAITTGESEVEIR